MICTIYSKRITLVVLRYDLTPVLLTGGPRQYLIGNYPLSVISAETSNHLPSGTDCGVPAIMQNSKARQKEPLEDAKPGS